MARGNAGTIESKTLLVIQEFADEDRGKKVQLRVVDWISNGTKHYPQLEKREWFKNEETGNWTTGKAKGMNGGDFIAVMKVWPKVVSLLGADIEAVEAAIGSANMSVAAAKPPPQSNKPLFEDQPEDF